MSIEMAFRKVSAEIGLQSVALAEEFTLTTAELSYLQDRKVAYENLARRTGIDGAAGDFVFGDDDFGKALNGFVLVRLEGLRLVGATGGFLFGGGRVMDMLGGFKVERAGEGDFAIVQGNLGRGERYLGRLG